MSAAPDVRAPSAVLRAPRSGMVSLHSPAALCGELELFDEGHVVLAVEGEPVTAPGRGFVLRSFVEDGARVSAGSPVVELRLA